MRARIWGAYAIALTAQPSGRGPCRASGRGPPPSDRTDTGRGGFSADLAAPSRRSIVVAGPGLSPGIGMVLIFSCYSLLCTLIKKRLCTLLLFPKVLVCARKQLPLPPPRTQPRDDPLPARGGAARRVDLAQGPQQVLDAHLERVRRPAARPDRGRDLDAERRVAADMTIDGFTGIRTEATCHGARRRGAGGAGSGSRRSSLARICLTGPR